MPSPLRLGATLMIICVVAAGLLAFTNAATEPIIAANEQAQLEAALRELLPQADNFESVVDKDKQFYVATRDKENVGVIAVFSQKGFGGQMQLIAGLDTEGRITGFKVLQHGETPGLGARIAEPEFADQFVGKSSADEFQVGMDINAISGATISSSSVAGALKLITAEIEQEFYGQQVSTAIPVIPDGIYDGEGVGFKGPIKLKIIVVGGEIADIEVVEEQETPHIGGVAVPEMNFKIMAAQNLDVDAVSGATFTSEGVIAAVQNALELAVGDSATISTGVYEGEAHGEQGTIKVRVIVTDGQVTDVQLLDQD